MWWSGIIALGMIVVGMAKERYCDIETVEAGHYNSESGLVVADTLMVRP